MRHLEFDAQLLGRTVASLAAFSALISCGGGSGSAADPLAPADLIDLAKAQSTWSIETGGVGGDSDGDAGTGGTAGEGSPKRNATVVFTDAAGKVLTGQTDANGNYLIKFKAAEVKAPYVVKVVDAAGNVLSSVTEQVVPSGKVSRANITPMTDKVTSDALVASVAGTDKAFTGASVDTGKLGTAKANMTASVKDALTAAGIADSSRFDPVRSIFAFNGTGVDAVIESISHSRDPATGATQLRAKLAPLVTNADGTITPPLITAATPLPPAQVALPDNAALTYSKITKWITLVNDCLTNNPQLQPKATCDAGTSFISTSYKQNSKDFNSDFNLLQGDPHQNGIPGSTFSNPNILFIGRYPGSTVDDLTVVEVTIDQPRVGPLAGGSAVPIRYTKHLVFKRDDTTPGLAAGNWVLYGNQRNFDWSIDPRYLTIQQLNAASTCCVSRATTGIRLRFSPWIFDPVSKTYVNAGVYAVRLTGPGLPTAGVVYAPASATGAASFTILNKTGAVPAPGTTSPAVQPDFRIAGVAYPSGTAFDAKMWSALAGSSPAYADVQTTDFSALQAYSRYTLEIYQSGSSVPIVETARMLAPIEAPSAYVQRPLHDLTPSTGYILPPQPATTSVVASWVRNPLAIRIENASFGSRASGVARNGSAAVADAFQLSPSSTSVTITLPPAVGAAPALDATSPRGDYREIGISGSAGRATFSQFVQWVN